MDFSILSSIFDTLPERTIGFKPVFNYGSHADLLRFLRQKRKEGVAYYPLIWLQTPYKSSYNRLGHKTEAKLILANLSNQNSSNIVRNDNNLKLVLFPLLEDVLHSLQHNGVASYDMEDYSVEVFFNYLPDEKGASDIWDAILLEVSIEFKNNCKIKKINYGN